MHVTVKLMCCYVHVTYKADKLSRNSTYTGFFFRIDESSQAFVNCSD